MVTVKSVSARRRNSRHGTWREFQSKPRLYVSVDSENMAENFAFRWDRPVAEFRKALPEVLRRLGLPEGTKARWNQKAGCSCGCSPGFVLDIPTTRRKNLTLRHVARLDFWATLGADAPKVATVNDRVVNRAESFAALV